MTRKLQILCVTLLLPGVVRATPSLVPVPVARTVEGGPGLPAQNGEDKARCKVRFVHATAKSGEFDKRLAPIRKKLKSLPFKSFKWLGEADLTIPRGKSRSTAVPNGAQMSVKFIEKLLEGEKRLKLRLQVKVPPKLKKAIGTMPNGSTWPVVVLDRKKGGKLVITLTCRAR